jgi:hypothetical protein
MIKVEMLAFTKNEELTTLTIKDSGDDEVMMQIHQGKEFKVSLHNLMNVLKMFEEAV